MSDMPIALVFTCTEVLIGICLHNNILIIMYILLPEMPRRGTGANTCCERQPHRCAFCSAWHHSQPP